MPRKEGEEAPPDWLENVERQREVFDHCPRCGQTIPAYAEGVCPRCQQTRKVLWRLMDVAKPYRARVWAALILTIVVTALSTAFSIRTGNARTLRLAPRYAWLGLAGAVGPFIDSGQVSRSDIPTVKAMFQQINDALVRATDAVAHRRAPPQTLCGRRLGSLSQRASASW